MSWLEKFAYFWFAFVAALGLYAAGSAAFEGKLVESAISFLISAAIIAVLWRRKSPLVR